MTEIQKWVMTEVHFKEYIDPDYEIKYPDDIEEIEVEAELYGKKKDIYKCVRITYNGKTYNLSNISDNFFYWCCFWQNGNKDPDLQ
jgi:hypothetical protein